MRIYATRFCSFRGLMIRDRMLTGICFSNKQLISVSSCTAVMQRLVKKNEIKYITFFMPKITLVI